MDSGTVEINLDKLGYENDPNPYKEYARLVLYSRIPTKSPFFWIGGYNGIGSETRKLAERLFGKEDQFKRVMKTFHDSGIEDILMQVVGPHFVTKYVTQSPTVFATELSVNRAYSLKKGKYKYRIGILAVPFTPSRKSE